MIWADWTTPRCIPETYIQHAVVMHTFPHSRPHTSQCVRCGNGLVPMTSDWIKEMWGVKNGILFGHKQETTPSAAKQMKLESIVVSEISQTQKVKYCRFFSLQET